MTRPLAEALLAWLLTYAIHSTVLLGGAWLLVRSRRLTAASADIAWKVAIVGALCTATAQGLMRHEPWGTFRLAGVASVAAPADPVGQPSVPDAPGSSRGATLGAAGAMPALNVRDAGDAGAGSAPRLVAAPPSAATGDAASARGTAARAIAGALPLLWLMTALALVAWYVARRLVLVGRLGDRRSVLDGDTLARFESLRQETGARRPVRLTASNAIAAPVAMADEICLPEPALRELDPGQLRAVLAHELAHVERRDPAWLLAACLLERAFFFQPLHRVARVALQRNAEYCADAWAARNAGGIPLAKALVRVAEWMQASPLGVPVAGFAEERSQLAVRVARLLEGAVGAPRARAAAVGLAGLALVVTAGFAPGVSARVQAAGGPEVVADADAPETDLPSAPDDAAPPSEPAGRADTAIVRAVMARLRDEDADVRRAAAEALGRFRHVMAIDALVIALDDLDADVRRAALHALGDFERAPVPAPPIRRKLEDPDPEMRATAVRVLAELRDRAAVPRITQLVVDRDPDVRYSALHALEALDATVPEAVLSGALADASSEVREAAAGLAGERQVVAVVPRLVQLLDDRSGSVRERAAYALTEMRTPAAHEALRRALAHRDAVVRRIAVEYFGAEVDR